MSMVHRLTVPIVFLLRQALACAWSPPGAVSTVQRRLIQAEKADKIQTKLNGW